MEAPVLACQIMAKKISVVWQRKCLRMGVMIAQNERKIVYASRMLSNALRNYTIMEREYLAVVWAFENFRLFFTSLKKLSE